MKEVVAVVRVLNIAEIMVKLRVSISMELEGVTDIQPADEDYQYFFNVMCTNCREEHPKVISFNQKDEVELSGSRGTANFAWRCQHCKKEHSASFLPSSPPSKSLQPLTYTSTNAAFTPLIILDCRGLEITTFHFRGKWSCKGIESGSKFTFDLDDREEGGSGEDEGRWDDYDEKAGEPVGVSEMRFKIERA